MLFSWTLHYVLLQIYLFMLQYAYSLSNPSSDLLTHKKVVHLENNLSLDLLKCSFDHMWLYHYNHKITTCSFPLQQNWILMLSIFFNNDQNLIKFNTFYVYIPHKTLKYLHSQLLLDFLVQFMSWTTYIWNLRLI